MRQGEFGALWAEHDPSGNPSGYGTNKLNGYHYPQNDEDPRPPTPEWNDNVLLLQLGDYDELSWGDCGQAKFFIPRKDLHKRDFSKVTFHWDST